MILTLLSEQEICLLLKSLESMYNTLLCLVEVHVATVVINIKLITYFVGGPGIAMDKDTKVRKIAP